MREYDTDLDEILGTEEREATAVADPDDSELEIALAIEDVKEEDTGSRVYESHGKESSEGYTETYGGYGTTGKGPGTSPNQKKTDYDDIFSHIGTFQARNMFDGLRDINTAKEDVRSEPTREVVRKETVDIAAWHMRYVELEMVQDFGLVPPSRVKVDSKEWEKYVFQHKIPYKNHFFKLMSSIA